MCGIYGIFRRGRACEDVHERELRRMGERLMLRGPDGHGTFRSPDGRVLLGHRRLAIIDLSERAAQPMTTRDGSFTITFNGEIYNYRALREELEREGLRFPTVTRTPRCCCTPTRVTAQRWCTSYAACSRSRSLMRQKARCCSRAIRTASSRSTTPMTVNMCALLRRSVRCARRVR